MRWWQIRKRDADVERELQSDLELEEEEQREHGVPPEEARHAALRSFGNPTLISEQTRAVWSWNGLESRSEEHTSELQSLTNLVCRLLLEKKKKNNKRKD